MQIIQIKVHRIQMNIAIFFRLFGGCSLADLGGARPARAPPFAWHPSSLADLGGRAPPHLPGILVFDDILGHIV